MPDFTGNYEATEENRDKQQGNEEANESIREALNLTAGEVNPSELAEGLLQLDSDNPHASGSVLNILLASPLRESLVSSDTALQITSEVNERLDEDKLREIISDRRGSDYVDFGARMDDLEQLINTITKLFRLAENKSENYNQLENIALDLLGKLRSIDDNRFKHVDILDPNKDWNFLTEGQKDQEYKDLEYKVQYRAEAGQDTYLKQQAKEQLIRSLGAFASEKCIQPMLNLMRQEPAAYPDYVAPMLSESVPGKSAQRIMEELKSGSINPMYKRDLAKVLYKLELGKINISEKGVEYLERRYDLQELNDPQFFAKRLTGKGQMGVFDEKGEMQGMFDLGDLTDGNKEIQAEVYDLTYEMLFVPKEDESEQERKRREQVLEEFKEHYFDFYGEEFHEETGVYFNNLDLREQGAFMQFAREADDEQAEAAMSVVKKYGESGLQSFVAHAENPDMGKVLLEIADSLPDAVAQSVFSEYAGFVEVVDDLESYIADEFNIEDPDRLGNRVANAILERGEKLLRSARADKSDYDELSRTLSDLANSTLVFLHGLKELRRSDQPMDPELLEKLEMARTDSESISDQEFAQMEDIYAKNYPKDRYDEVVQETLLNKLKQIRQSNHGEFYTLKYKDEIKAFLGLKEDEAVDGRPIKQAAAFNVDPEFQNFAVGHMMIENALVREADSSVLIANSNAQSTLTAHYIERGFIGTQITDQHESKVLDIVWDRDQNAQYRFKHSNIADIVETFDRHSDSRGVARPETGEKIIKKDSWNQVNLESHLSEGVATRVFSEDGEWYVVFEPAPNKEYPESMK